MFKPARRQGIAGGVSIDTGSKFYRQKYDYFPQKESRKYSQNLIDKAENKEQRFKNQHPVISRLMEDFLEKKKVNYTQEEQSEFVPEYQKEYDKLQDEALKAEAFFWKILHADKIFGDIIDRTRIYPTSDLDDKGKKTKNKCDMVVAFSDESLLGIDCTISTDPTYLRGKLDYNIHKPKRFLKCPTNPSIESNSPFIPVVLGLGERTLKKIEQALIVRQQKLDNLEENPARLSQKEILKERQKMAIEGLLSNTNIDDLIYDRVKSQLEMGMSNIRKYLEKKYPNKTNSKTRLYEKVISEYQAMIDNIEFFKKQRQKTKKRTPVVEKLKDRVLNLLKDPQALLTGAV